MGKIQFINEFEEDESFDYNKRIRLLKKRKLDQTQEKIDMEGGLDEDDYGRVVARMIFSLNVFPIMKTDPTMDMRAGGLTIVNF